MNHNNDLNRDQRSAGQSDVAVHCESISSRGRRMEWRLDENRHYDLHQFLWITRGGGRAKIDGVVHGFGANTAIYIPALMVHAFEFTHASVGWIVSMHEAAQITMPDNPVMSVIPRPGEQVVLTSEFSGLNAEYIGDNVGRDDALIHHAGLLAVHFSRMKTDGSRIDFTKDSARRRLMKKFVARLEGRFDSADTVKDYASALDITTTHLTRVCRETTGKPATKMIQDRTMLEAKRTLANTDQRIARIADNLGFQTPAYFSRVFTTHVGKSPRDYRHDNRELSKTNPAGSKVI